MHWNTLTAEELIRACLENGKASVWEEFVRRFRPVIAATVMRVSRRYGVTAPDLIDDLIQQTYVKIWAHDCRVLREFESRAPDAIFGLLKTVAFSVAHDYFRLRKPRTDKEVPLDPSSESTSSRQPPAAVERQILLREIEELLAGAKNPPIPERDRQIFWFYYRHGMTARAISLVPGFGLTQKGVESVIQRLTNQVRSWLVELKPERAEGKTYGSSL